MQRQEEAIQLLRHERLANAFVARQFTGLIGTMRASLKRMLKPKRKRRTTRQLIAQQVLYLESFSLQDTAGYEAVSDA